PVAGQHDPRLFHFGPLVVSRLAGTRTPESAGASPYTALVTEFPGRRPRLILSDRPRDAACAGWARTNVGISDDHRRVIFERMYLLPKLDDPRHLALSQAHMCSKGDRVIDNDFIRPYRHQSF